MSDNQRINTIPSDKFHEITIEILRHSQMSGTPLTIADTYWEAYINVYNFLVKKSQQTLSK